MTVGSMPFKVTGHARDGRYDFFREDWHMVRQPPKFFSSEKQALKYLDDLEIGILWERNEEEDARNEYSVRLTLNTSWPEGARAGVKNYKKQGSPLDEAMEKQNE